MQASEGGPSLSLRSACQVYHPSAVMGRHARACGVLLCLASQSLLFEEKYGVRFAALYCFSPGTPGAGCIYDGSSWTLNAAGSSASFGRCPFFRYFGMHLCLPPKNAPCQVYQPSGTMARQAVLAVCSFVLPGDLFEEKYGSRLQSSISFTWQVIEVIAM